MQPAPPCPPWGLSRSQRTGHGRILLVGAGGLFPSQMVLSPSACTHGCGEVLELFGVVRPGLALGALLGIAYLPCRKESRVFRILGTQGSLRLLLLLHGAVPRPMGAFHTPSHLTEVAAAPGGFVGSSCPMPPAPHGRTVPILLGTGGAHGGGGSAPCPHKPVPASLGLLCLRGLLGVFWGAPKGVAPTPHGGVVFSYGERASELKARVSQQPREPISSKGSHLHPDFLSSVRKGDY